MSCVREYFGRRQIPTDITQVLMASYRQGTHKSYATYLQNGFRFAVTGCRITLLRRFMTRGTSSSPYSIFNTARSALSTIIMIEGYDFGTHPVATRFMKGVFETRLPSPKYTTCNIWDISIVLKHLTEFYPYASQSLKDLTFKVLMLLFLVSGQRGQTIGTFLIFSIWKWKNIYVFMIFDNTLEPAGLVSLTPASK